MRWTERQRAMLREMGVRLWEREPVGIVEAPLALDAEESPDAPAPRAPVATPAAAPTLPAAPASGPQETLLPAADWLFVGEPLDGGAGGGAEAQLLDNMLRAIGVARDGGARGRRASYLALAERPASGADADRRERIRRALEIVQPACIVALGRSAAHAVLGGDEALGSLRGRRHAHAGVPVFVTCPLAFLLRHPDEKGKAWADLCLAVTAADAARSG